MSETQEPSPARTPTALATAPAARRADRRRGLVSLLTRMSHLEHSWTLGEEMAGWQIDHVPAGGSGVDFEAFIRAGAQPTRRRSPRVKGAAARLDTCSLL